MPHRADPSFFDEKREWSKRKDQMLDFYLEPYLPKVARLGKPILIVDGFAGPGRFKDGELGSPLIICEQVAKRIEAGCSVPIEVLCVESDSQLFADLADNIGGYRFAQARHQTFLESVDEIEQLARDHTVFLYLDPFAITGLEWASLDRVFRFLDAHRSIEILLNLNGSALGRTARQALGMTAPEVADDLHDASIPGDGGTKYIARPVLIVSHLTLLLENPKGRADRGIARWIGEPLVDLGRGGAGLTIEDVHDLPFAIAQAEVAFF